MTWIRKKYTKVITAEIDAGKDAWERTISLIGGKNSNDLNGTVSLVDVNQDNQLRTDMGLY